MGGKPDWIFCHDDKPSEAEVIPRLIAEFPGFRLRWEKHLELWKGEPAESYNEIAEFAHFVAKDLYPNGNTANLQRAFGLMEHWLVNGNQKLRNLIAVGFSRMFRMSRHGRRLGEKHSFRFSGRNLVRRGMKLRGFGLVRQV